MIYSISDFWIQVKYDIEGRGITRRNNGIFV